MQLEVNIIRKRCKKAGKQFSTMTGACDFTKAEIFQLPIKKWT